MTDRMLVQMLVLCSWIMGFTPATAGTLYVTTNGVGTPPYDSWTNAAPSIQVAIDHATNGDTVLAGPGTYYGSGNRDISFRGKAITLQSADGATNTILDVEGTVDDPHRAFRFSDGETDSAVLDGFTITGGYGPKDILTSPDTNLYWYVGGAIYCASSSPSIVNCVFSNNYAVYGSAIQLWDQSHAQIENCKFIDNHTGVDGNTLHAYSFCNARVRNCTFTANEGISVEINFGSDVELIGCLVHSNLSGSCAVYVGNSYLTLLNCTIADNQCSAGGLDTWYCWGAPVVRNCILWNNTLAVSEISGTSSALVFNACIEKGYPGSSVITNHPLFEAQGVDYRLQLSSPCIDQGTTTDDMFSHRDIAGNLRVVNGIVDIGAFEYGFDVGRIWCRNPDTASFVVEWESISGSNYVFESQASLVEGDWSPVGTTLLGNGKRMSVTNSIPPETTRSFYRMSIPGP
jgi:hypothetical protein